MTDETEVTTEATPVAETEATTEATPSVTVTMPTGASEEVTPAATVDETAQALHTATVDCLSKAGISSWLSTEGHELMAKWEELEDYLQAEYKKLAELIHSKL